MSGLHGGPAASPALPSARDVLDFLWPGHGLPETARVLSIECGFNAFVDGYSVSVHVTGSGAEAWVAALPASASAYVLDGRVHLRRRDGQRMGLVILDRAVAP